MLKSKLHQGGDVQFCLERSNETIKQRLRQIPAELTPKLIGEVQFQRAHDRIYAAIERALKQLSTYDATGFTQENEAYLESLGAGMPAESKDGEDGEIEDASARLGGI